ncbi:GDP-mannose-dependent alpha-mannosyltransferase [Seminavis robusta]|uniref:GDP-mannose-dependent alpha-mannosyltransferase n=1 Tax=Seminavis robusta TaxID=568900 RepID=A0A9N8HHR4_9STRA|nr:GDP-mannose-dependent alpha-mannosyltransferase [Seminavis robusta]|eukprot:Sro725_g193350.1 GDP-mannose-dependent alpha-mannosyltransferase (430) ;mRNA; f:38361-39650
MMKNATNTKRRILIVSDVAVTLSGVATALGNTERILSKWGHEVLYVTPTTLDLWTIPLIGVDNGFKLAFPYPHSSKIERVIDEFNPDCVHVSTEASLGKFVRTLCLKKGWRFSTAFHTMSAEFLECTIGIPAWVSWEQLRQFHSESASVMAPTQSVRGILQEKGWDHGTLKHWSRGVNAELFYPREKDPVKFPKQNGPILMYVGRVSVEKGIEEFLKLPIQKGTKYVVGDGMQRQYLEKKFPSVIFLGYIKGDDLATAYSNADVIVFPSKTDTFGNTITEALACGTPVAAFPAPGPLDTIGNKKEVGSVNEDLAQAIEDALTHGDSEICAKYVRENYTWEIATQQFLDNLVFRHNPKGHALEGVHKKTDGDVECLAQESESMLLVSSIMSLGAVIFEGLLLITYVFLRCLRLVPSYTLKLLFRNLQRDE